MKFTYKDKGGYSEIGQPNPIRWAILSGTPSEGFVNESSWLKCKDFFNDYVVAYNGGERFSIYNFTTKPMTIPPKGEPVFMAVKDLTPTFETNLETINASLPEPLAIHHASCGAVIIEIPAYYFQSTYNISLLSLMIRLCNITHQFSSYEEFVGYKAHAKQDQNLWDTVVAKKVFFALPEELRNYMWYCGEQYNNKVFKGKDYQLADLVHNCGLMAYSKHF